MVKNRLQTELAQTRLQTLEYGALHSLDIAENHFDKNLINPTHFSKGAKRNFDMIKHVLIETGLGPRTDFESEVEQKLQELYFENDYLKEETQRVEFNNYALLKPKFEQKLTLRDMLESLYEGKIKGMSKEMQLLTLKLKTENKRIVDQLNQGGQELKQIQGQTTSQTEVPFDINKFEEDLQEVELLSQQHYELERQVEQMRLIIKNEFGNLNSDVHQAKVQLAQLKDIVIANEETLRKCKEFN